MKGVFSETPKCFKALTLLAPMSYRAAINFQYFSVASIKNLDQEINKHLTLSASFHQVSSKWLLPLVIETMQHEDQGMIYNIACPAMVSEVHKALHTAKLMKGTQILSD
jgi:hypothetical protein